MIKEYLEKKKAGFIVFPLMMLLMMSFTTKAKALDVIAKSCSHVDVQSAVSKVETAGSGTVFIPSGECTWSDDVDIVGDINIIGAGISQTILSLDPSKKLFFEHTGIVNFVRYSGIRFNADNRTSSATAISLRYPDNFRIDHCYFYGRWYPTIVLKMVKKGLIDHVTIENDNSRDGNPYGISVSGPSMSKPSCLDPQDKDCLDEWDAWWDNSSLHEGIVFDENYIPGTDNAVFVEDCTFINGRTNIIGNWGAIAAFTVRYCTFTIDNPLHGQISQKPGTVWIEAYNNTFTYTGTGDGSRAFYTRSSGLIYDNTFTRMGLPGQLEVKRDGYGYIYTDQVLMDELYIYNNIYVDCKYSGDNSTGWHESPQGNPELIAENSEYFFRAPQSGDRIYPYTPYIYPHPLTSGVSPKPKPKPGKLSSPTGLRIEKFSSSG